MNDFFEVPTAVADSSGWAGAPRRMGFFTDTSVCIGCKACEVACKEWNAVPEDGLQLLGSSYDNTGALGASTWRHVAFIEQSRPLGSQHPGDAPAADTMMASGAVLEEDPASPGSRAAGVDLGMPSFALPGSTSDPATATDFRWLMSSDVCKHCTHAACLDVCPTGALFRTEYGTVVVQEDVCNGCGYCVPACPFGVIDRRVSEPDVKNHGLAQKCTLCYDRLQADKTPACAQACPTDSIQFGDLDELRKRAEHRRQQLVDAGVAEARLYGADQSDGVGGAGAFFLLLDEPEVYGLPPDPIVATRDLPDMWRKAVIAAGTFALGMIAAFVGRRG